MNKPYNKHLRYWYPIDAVFQILFLGVFCGTKVYNILWSTKIFSIHRMRSEKDLIVT